MVATRSRSDLPCRSQLAGDRSAPAAAVASKLAPTKATQPGNAMTLRIALLASLAIAASAPAHADTLVIHAGKLVDVDAGTVLVDQAVRIEDGKVASVAPWSATSAG